MANLEISFETIKKEIKKNDITLEQLSDILFDFGLEIDSYDKDTDEVKIEITAERIDLLSVQGFLRSLKAYLSIQDCPIYCAKDSGSEVNVDASAREYGNYTVCAIVKNLNLTDEKIKEIINIQEKLHLTYCRKRKSAAIGVYPLEKIKFPITFLAEEPKKIKFIPLGETKELTGEQILIEHETGKEYAYLISGKKKYLIFMDSNDQVLSMPPIINSESTGRITENTKDVFIECTGQNLIKLKYLLSIITTVFKDLGGEVYSLNINYPDGTKMIAPDFIYDKKTISIKDANKILGTEITTEGSIDLLKKMSYQAKVIDKDKVEVLVPPFRSDVLHDYDVFDDLARAYGFSNIKLKTPHICTIGGLDETTEKQDNIIKLMVGMRLCEVMPLTLSSNKQSFENFNLSGNNYIDLGFSADFSLNIVSNWLIPKLFVVLSNNQHRSYPQQIFACDEVVIFDRALETRSKNVLHTACLIANTTVTFTEVSSILLTLCNSLGKELKLEKDNFPYYIKGRSAKVIIDGKNVGTIGEFNPDVLTKNNYSMPVAGFEIEI